MKGGSGIQRGQATCPNKNSLSEAEAGFGLALLEAQASDSHAARPVVGKRPGLQQSQLREVRLFIVPAALCAALDTLEQSGEGGGPQGVTLQTDATETSGQPGRQKVGSGQGTCGGGGPLCCHVMTRHVTPTVKPEARGLCTVPPCSPGHPLPASTSVGQTLGHPAEARLRWGPRCMRPDHFALQVFENMTQVPRWIPKASLAACGPLSGRGTGFGLRPPTLPPLHPPPSASSNCAAPPM